MKNIRITVIIMTLFAASLFGGCAPSAGSELERHMGSLSDTDTDIFISMHYQYQQMENMDAFLSAVEAGQPAHLDTVSYTVEGDPVFRHVRYDGETFQFAYDGSRDPYLSDNAFRQSSYRYLHITEKEAENNVYRSVILSNEEDALADGPMDILANWQEKDDSIWLPEDGCYWGMTLSEAEVLFSGITPQRDAGWYQAETESRLFWWLTGKLYLHFPVQSDGTARLSDAAFYPEDTADTIRELLERRFGYTGLPEPDTAPERWTWQTKETADSKKPLTCVTLHAETGNAAVRIEIDGSGGLTAFLADSKANPSP